MSRLSWHTLKKLTVGSTYWGIVEYKNDQQVIDHKTLEKVLILCGRFITEINLRYSPGRSGETYDQVMRIQPCEKVFSLIYKCCPNIKTLWT